MKETVLIVGGGISGLAAAGFLRDAFDCTLIERDNELGGYCRTIARNGFVWDYSGHFFHFRNQWVSDYVYKRIDSNDILRVKKISSVCLNGSYIDAPIQYHIDQLPKDELLRCLADMYDAQQHSAEAGAPATFIDMLRRRCGAWLTEEFLRPYNEKLYGLSLDQLDTAAMGRFFPHVDFSQLLRVLARRDKIDTYNEHFSYHRRGARGYVEALASYVPTANVRLGVECTQIDLERKRAQTTAGEISYDRLIVSAPLPRVLMMAGIEFPQNALTANKVAVFNIGFDRAAGRDEHWIYFPDARWPFYRVGFYNNILGQERMSIYVEVSLGPAQTLMEEGMLPRVMEGLRQARIVDGHEIVDYEPVLMDPAYVHVRPGTVELAREFVAKLNACDVYPIGRYGQWKYCSIEDNIIDAFELARSWGVQNELMEGAAASKKSA